MQKQWIDFSSNDRFNIYHGPINYAELLTESSILITDYSSVAFDFAYLQKPVIYCPFDHDSFFASHTYKEGYFNYSTDGFGPVCSDVQSLVNATIHLIENNGTIGSDYLQRIKAFYAYFDNNNSKRVHQAILERDIYNKKTFVFSIYRLLVKVLMVLLLGLFLLWRLLCSCSLFENNRHPFRSFTRRKWD